MHEQEKTIVRRMSDSWKDITILRQHFAGLCRGRDELAATARQATAFSARAFLLPSL